MRKRTLMFGVILVLAVAWAWCVSAYAAEGEANAWHGFWSSVGGFIYNALPWNWGNWWGK